MRSQKGNIIFLILIAVAIVSVVSIVIPPLLDVTGTWTLTRAMDVLEDNGYSAFADTEGNFTVSGNMNVGGNLNVGGTMSGSFSETSTLDSVLTRGNSSTRSATFGSVTSTGTLTAATGRGATFVLAASNSSTLSKEQADCVCVAADCLPDINDAVSKLSSRGGGRIYFFSGTYPVSGTISITSSNIVLEGEGRGSTELKLNANADCDAITITGTGVEKVEIRNLGLNGNRGNNVAGCGISISTPYVNSGNWHIIDNVYVHDFSENGVEVLYSGTPTDACTFTNILSRHNEGHAYTILGADHYIANCIANGCWKSGFYDVGGHTRIENCRVDGCGADTGAIWHGFYFGASSSYVRAESLVAQDNDYAGFVIQCLRSSFVNCEADRNSTRTNTYSGFHFGSNAISNEISGGYTGNSTGTTQGRGVGLMADTAISNHVHDLLFYNNTSGDVDGSAARIANNIFRSNPGFTTVNSGTLACDGTYQQFNHGLDVTPDEEDFYLTCLGSDCNPMVSSGTAPTSTQGCVKCDNGEVAIWRVDTEN